jgi:hypothetical protein
MTSPVLQGAAALKVPSVALQHSHHTAAWVPEFEPGTAAVDHTQFDEIPLLEGTARLEKACFWEGSATLTN